MGKITHENLSFDAFDPPLVVPRQVWDSVYGFDMSVIKEIAITEPLVDVVEGKAVVSNAVPILNLDLLTCSKVVGARFVAALPPCPPTLPPFPPPGLSG